MVYEGSRLMSNLRKQLPFLVGNVGIVSMLAWIGTSGFGLGRLIATGVLSLALFNGTLVITRRASRSRAPRSSTSVPPLENVAVRSGPGKWAAIALATLGLLIFVVGTAVPMRLPRAERNSNKEFFSSVAALALCVAAGRLERSRKR